MTRLICTILLTILTAAAAGAARAATPESARSLIEEASAAYAAGARKLSSDREAAIESFKLSAALYRQAAQEHAASGPLMYNIGNASMLAGETGQAVLWYKRAERAMPNDAAVRVNLAKARDAVGANAPRADSIMDQLTIIEFVPAAARFWIAAAALTSMWGLASWRLLSSGWRPGRLLITACAAAALLSGASLIPRELRLHESTEAVLLTETTGRAGPDAGAYEPKPAAPLKAGVEARIIEERGPWLLVELGDNTRTWVEAKSIERVAL